MPAAQLERYDTCIQVVRDKRRLSCNKIGNASERSNRIVSG